MTEELHTNPEYPIELPYRRVLDHGFVALVEVMGSDSSIVQAARVSYGKGTKTVRSDKALISYLARHRHTTPTEMIEFKFLMRLPVFIARQVVRHRTASLNEYSGRYSIVPDRFWVPDLGAIADQDEVNRQGRMDMIRKLADALPERSAACAHVANQKAALVAEDGRGISRVALREPAYRAAFLKHWRAEASTDMLPSQEHVFWVEQLLEFHPETKARFERIRDAYREQNERSYAMYQGLMKDGVAREIARSILPLSMYTEWYWKMDLHNLFHFLKLRMDPHAQLEVRAFAEATATFVKEQCPMAWESFEKDTLHGVWLSSDERATLRPKDSSTQRQVLEALYERGYRARRLKEVCRKLDIDETIVDELWPKKPKA